MIDQFKPWYSLDDLSERVLEIENLVDSSPNPLDEDEIVSEYLGVMERRVSRSGSRLSTGRRAKQEAEALEDDINVYTQLLGAIALDTVTKVFDETGSVDKAKQAGLGVITESKVDVYAEDIGLRFEKSAVERFKRRMGRRPIERFALPMALYGAAASITNAVIVKASETSSSIVDLTPAQGGVVFLAWGIAIRLAGKSLPRQAGEQLKGRANVTLGRYIPKRKLHKNGEADNLPVREYLPIHYAEDHLEIPLHIIKSSMMDYVVDDKDGLRPMVAHVLETTKEQLYRSYEMELYRDDRSLYQKMLGKLAIAS